MNKKGIDAVALSVRSLSMDAIQKANSGHPGLPLGCAELAAVLYGQILRHNPADPRWADRDRFVLSAGHGSMLLYSILHLSGYKVSLEDIKTFRQVGSKCPGHPEYGVTEGVETTTGPLGQGLATAVGMAIAETMLAARFNTAEEKIVDHYTYALVGEGCLMEGVASEASSLAGALKLGKLIVFYDENKITIDGSSDITFTEDAGKRYEAYGWQVLKGDMYDIEGICGLVEQAKRDSRPSFIMLKSVIGKGAPTVAGSAKAHGAPIGADGVKLAKETLGLPADREFYVVPEAYSYFEERRNAFAAAQAEWNTRFAAWARNNPAKKAEWDAFYSGKPLAEAVWPQYKTGDQVATRNASGASLNAVAAAWPNLVGGSADLQGPNVTAIKGASDYSAQNPGGRYLRYGIREFGMAAVANGIALHGGLKSFCATFMVFSDYLRPALRLSALMKVPVTYVLTHDSIFIGEDGPTHQPVETLAALRAIPNTLVLRPGDAEETNIAWRMAAQSETKPVCLALTRQNVPVYEKDDPDWQNTVQCGAYIVRKGAQNPDITVLASGSEVSMALEAAKQLSGKAVRVVSVLDRELFSAQPEALRKTIIGENPRVIAVEAGISMGWERFLECGCDFFGLSGFGESGPGNKVAEYFGFTAAKLAEHIQKRCAE